MQRPADVHPGHYLEKRSEEHTSELQSQSNLVCRLLLEKKKKTKYQKTIIHKKYKNIHIYINNNKNDHVQHIILRNVDDDYSVVSSTLHSTRTARYPEQH